MPLAFATSAKDFVASSVFNSSAVIPRTLAAASIFEPFSLAPVLDARTEGTWMVSDRVTTADLAKTAELP